MWLKLDRGNLAIPFKSQGRRYGSGSPVDDAVPDAVIRGLGSAVAG
jgi:hypothetical protein